MKNLIIILQFQFLISENGTCAGNISKSTPDIIFTIESRRRMVFKAIVPEGGNLEPRREEIGLRGGRPGPTHTHQENMSV